MLTRKSKGVESPRGNATSPSRKRQRAEVKATVLPQRGSVVVVNIPNEHDTPINMRHALSGKLPNTIVARRTGGREYTYKRYVPLKDKWHADRAYYANSSIASTSNHAEDGVRYAENYGWGKDPAKQNRAVRFRILKINPVTGQPSIHTHLDEQYFKRSRHGKHNAPWAVLKRALHGLSNTSELNNYSYHTISVNGRNVSYPRYLTQMPNIYSEYNADPRSRSKKLASQKEAFEEVLKYYNQNITKRTNKQKAELVNKVKKAFVVRDDRDRKAKLIVDLAMKPHQFRELGFLMPRRTWRRAPHKRSSRTSSRG